MIVMYCAIMGISGLVGVLLGIACALAGYRIGKASAVRELKTSPPVLTDEQQQEMKELEDGQAAFREMIQSSVDGVYNMDLGGAFE